MSTRQRHPAELRERATGMAVDLRRDPETYRGAVGRVAELIGINAETLRDWVKKIEIDGGSSPGVTTVESARVAELERENRELSRANQILKSSAVFFAAEFDRPSK